MSFWSNLAAKETPGAVQSSAEWGAIFGGTGNGAGIPLGTARWMPPETAIEHFRYPRSLYDGRIWLGEGFDQATSPLGYTDDRHVCLVSGSRGGKGVGVIVPNLCFWPGSAIVVDPKGENATVTAQRRGAGSIYAHGIGQKVFILDPFGEVQLPAALKARYNPLDAIDPNSDIAIDDAGRIAAALVVIENRNEPYWEEAARNLIKGVILHVLSAPYLRAHRNLVSVRRLLTQGDWLTVEKVRAAAADDAEMPSAFQVLWSQMRLNPAFNGVVAGVGEQMIGMADRQRSGVIESARTNTEFLDSIPMQRLLETSDFDLAELKTNAGGLTIYLTLPQRFMETHYRWLRLMIVLAVGEMERIKGRPATGHPTLFLLDEFAGLKRMEVIENAAAQAAGFGIKFLFVVQNLPQLEDLYEKSWETFLGNSGLKLFFQIDDDFTRSYLSRQLGELETLRQTRSGSQSQSTSDSTSRGTSTNTSTGRSTSRRPILHFRTSKQSSSGYSYGTSSSTSFSRSSSATDGWGEAVHKRPLLNPDEIGRLLARIDDHHRPGYPGLVLALIPGEHPLLARRVNYFESDRFIGYFDPHPNHPPPPTLADLARASKGPPWGLAPPVPAPQTLSEILRRVAQFLLSIVRGALHTAAGLVGLLIGLAGLVLVGAFLYGIAAGVYGHFHETPPAPTGARTMAAPSSPPAQIDPNYAKGIADWDALQKWFTAQSGDRLAGANYWSANRHVPGHLSCAGAATRYSGNTQLFAAGCADAEHILDPIDEHRHADPQYRTGFSDEAKRLPLQSEAVGQAGGAPDAIVKTPDDLKLRSGPGVSYAIVTTMVSGDRVKIIRDADNGWKELEFRDNDGQVFHGFSSGKYLIPMQ